MTALGLHDGEPLVVDLRSAKIASWDELWDTLSKPCGLPDWFGRNLDAWWDTIETGAISEVLDDHNGLVLLVSSEGIFAAGNEDGAAFVETTNRCRYAEVQLVSAGVADQTVDRDDL